MSDRVVFFFIRKHTLTLEHLQNTSVTDVSMYSRMRLINGSYTNRQCTVHVNVYACSFSQRLEKCYGELSGVMTRLGENDLFNHLNGKVSGV